MASNNLHPVHSTTLDEKPHAADHVEDTSLAEAGDREVVHPNGKKWESKTIHRVDARLIIIRESRIR